MKMGGTIVNLERLFRLGIENEMSCVVMQDDHKLNLRTTDRKTMSVYF